MIPGGPVAYARRALTDTESRYTQIEREALAVRWACRHFHLYLCGHTFRVVTDHKPLVPLFTGTARNGPPRIERWAVQLQPYAFDIVYRLGANNPADYLSRHPPDTPSDKLLDEIDEGAEGFILMITNEACPKSLSLQELQEATAKDPHLMKVKEALNQRQWRTFLERVKTLTEEDQMVRQHLWRIRDELSVSSCGLILRWRHIVVPQVLWERIIQLAHQGHQGIAKTKARLRHKVWFAGMDRKVEEKVRNCHSCAITGEEPPTAPVITEAANTIPWRNVSMDFGSFPDGRLTALLIDNQSKFPVVELIESTAFKNVRKVLEKTFALLGCPQELKTVNGLPFQGQEFQTYLRNLSISHRKITPNGLKRMERLKDSCAP